MPELLRRFLGPYRIKATVGILVKTVEVVLEVLTPLVVARMIDVGVANHDVDTVLRLGGTLCAFAAVSYCFTLVCQRLAAQVSQGVGTDVRNELFSHVMQLAAPEVAEFGTPTLVTRITNDVNQVQLAVALIIRTLTRWPLLALGSIVAALSIDIGLGFVFVVCLPIVVATFAYVMKASIPYFANMQQKLDQISAACRETLSGMRVIRAFGQQGRAERHGQSAIAEQAEVSMAVGALSAVLNPATFLVMNLGVTVILWVGGIQVEAGTLTTGQIVAFVSYMTQTLVSISYMANLVVVIMRGNTSSNRILEVLDCTSSVTSHQSSHTMTEKPRVALRLSGVGFTYAGASVPALDNISLELAPGQTLGIIGGTGSGKSTLTKLLPRLFDASVGDVVIMGRNVRDWNLHDLRHTVALVPQHVSLVTGTIRSNLLWRDAKADDAALWAALRASQAEDFVRKLTEGLDAPVEAGGRNFSGGQRQRLTIARALVGSPALIVLDDASSALDYATDARLRSSIASLHNRPTAVVVSQRVSTVCEADLILVLDHGRAAGLGTHLQLFETCPLYREICQTQGIDTPDEGREVAHG